ncbi:MAG: type II toxin-antitoxin system HicA family toxin [Nitrospinales bacterium]
MPRITPVHWKKLVCVFEKAGFVRDRQQGSHIILVKPDVERPVVIPKKPNVYTEVINNNIKTAGLTREDYFKLLKQC